jgi:hypothetical protein
MTTEKAKASVYALFWNMERHFEWFRTPVAL